MALSLLCIVMSDDAQETDAEELQHWSLTNHIADATSDGSCRTPS